MNKSIYDFLKKDQLYEKYRAILASVSSDSVDAFLKTMLSYIYYDREDKNLSPGVSKKLGEWSPAVEEFFKELSPKNRLVIVDFRTLRNIFNKNRKITTRLASIGFYLRNLSEELTSLPKIHQTRLNMLNDIRLVLTKDSEAAKKRLYANVTLLGDTDLNSLFLIPDEFDTSDIASNLEEMSKLNKRLTGKSTPWLSFQDAKKLTDEQQPLYEKYKAHRLIVNKALKINIQNILRGESKGVIKYTDLIEKLKLRGFTSVLPYGFTGEVGLLDGKPTLMINGKFIEGGLFSPTNTITMNRRYSLEEDDQYVLTVEDPGFKSIQRRYTLDFKSKGREEKFESVEEAIENIDLHKRRWLLDIAQPTDERIRITALMVYLIYRTAARIGSPRNNVNGKQTFGLSTLNHKHVRVNQLSIVFDYSGKKDIQQQHSYKPKEYRDIVPKTGMSEGDLVYSITKELIQKSKENKNKYLFQAGGKRISESEVRNYMRSIGMNITPHKLRHVEGTRLARLILIEKSFRKDNSSKKTIQKQAEDWFKKNVAEQVAIKLGHKSASGKALWSTSVANYISPLVTAQFFKDLNLRQPSWVEKLLSKV